ncbi:dUTP diphosphatase [Neisseria sp. N95_16]|uniref:dUTP diphosphatase n=1 Tax=Neisseria brasiliensis TaxID=2666100 RepID=A0A7X2GYZ6_9NEIS|nr:MULTISPECIES: dUTP diphosphatase [Neisseria]MRN38576.1 dUTP diphosphatase [Neisseria brasiliensis]PJO10493.1 dUTP diphosphatase [Neisseria sp. N95_16]
MSNLVERIHLMLYIQDELNSKLDPDWKHRNWNFRLAAQVEAYEALDHVGWKWWKYNTPDWEQARMELVDIWHFLLSEFIVQDTPAEYFAGYFTNLTIPSDLDKGKAIQALADYGRNTGCIRTVLEFTTMMEALGLSFEELEKWYLGKYCLNKLRWSHGYAEGSYIKIWNGREDNEYLTEYLNSREAITIEETSKYLEDIYTSIKH